MEPGQVIAKDFFIYTVAALALAPAATATGNIIIQADSDFVLQKIGYTADVAGAAQTDSSRIIPLVTVTITDSGSGRQIMDNAVPIPSFFGDGRLPFILPQAKVFVARTNIAFSFSNFSAATTYNVRLALIGMKLFKA